MNKFQKFRFAKLAKEVGEKVGGKFEKKASTLHDNIIADLRGGQMDTAIPSQGNSEDKKADQDDSPDNDIDELLNRVFN